MQEEGNGLKIKRDNYHPAVNYVSGKGKARNEEIIL